MSIELKTAAGRTAEVTTPPSLTKLRESAARSFSLESASVKLFYKGLRLTDENYLNVLARLSSPWAHDATPSPVLSPTVQSRAQRAKVSERATQAILVVGKRLLRPPGSPSGEAREELDSSTAHTRLPTSEKSKRVESQERRATRSSRSASAIGRTGSISLAPHPPPSESTSSDRNSARRSLTSRGSAAGPRLSGVGKSLGAPKGVGSKSTLVPSPPGGRRESKERRVLKEETKRAAAKGPLPYPYSSVGLQDLYRGFLQHSSGSEDLQESLPWNSTMKYIADYVAGDADRMRDVLAQIQAEMPLFFLWIDRNQEVFLDVLNVAAFNSMFAQRMVDLLDNTDREAIITMTNGDDDEEQAFFIICDMESGEPMIVMPTPTRENMQDMEMAGVQDNSHSSDGIGDAEMNAILEELELGLAECVADVDIEQLLRDFTRNGGARDVVNGFDMDEDADMGDVGNGDAGTKKVSRRALANTGKESKRFSRDGTRAAGSRKPGEHPGGDTAISASAPETSVLRSLMEELHDMWTNEQLVTEKGAERMGEMLTTLGSVRDSLLHLGKDLSLLAHVEYTLVANTQAAVQQKLGITSLREVPPHSLWSKHRLDLCLPWITSDGHLRLLSALRNYAREQQTALVIYSFGSVAGERERGSERDSEAEPARPAPPLAYVIHTEAGKAIDAVTLSSSSADIVAALGELDKLVERVSGVAVGSPRTSSAAAEAWRGMMKSLYVTFVEPVAPLVSPEAVDGRSLPERSVCFVGAAPGASLPPIACMENASGVLCGERWSVLQSFAPVDLLHAAKLPWASTSSPSLLVSSHPVAWLTPALQKDLRLQLGTSAREGDRARRESVSAAAALTIAHLEGCEAPTTPVPPSEVLVLAGGTPGEGQASTAWMADCEIHRAALWPLSAAPSFPAPYDLLRKFYTELRAGSSLGVAYQRALTAAADVHRDTAPWVCAAVALLHYGGPLRSLGDASPCDAAAACGAETSSSPATLALAPQPPRAVAVPSEAATATAPAPLMRTLVPQKPDQRSTPQQLQRNQRGSGGGGTRRPVRETREGKYVISKAVDEIFELMLGQLVMTRPTTTLGVYDTLIASLEDNREHLKVRFEARQREVALMVAASVEKDHHSRRGVVAGTGECSSEVEEVGVGGGRNDAHAAAEVEDGASPSRKLP